jgi:beta-lactamase class A
MAGLMEKLYKHEIVSPDASEKMLRLLGRNFWDEVAISQIPSHVFIASKNGAVNQSRSETILVMAPHGPYVFSITTKDLQDQSWTSNNEAWVLIRKLSRLLWNYYEPGSNWKPAMPVEGRSDGKPVEQE